MATAITRLSASVAPDSSSSPAFLYSARTTAEVESSPIRKSIFSRTFGRDRCERMHGLLAPTNGTQNKQRQRIPFSWGGASQLRPKLPCHVDGQQAGLGGRGLYSLLLSHIQRANAIVETKRSWILSSNRGELSPHPALGIATDPIMPVKGYFDSGAHPSLYHRILAQLISRHNDFKIWITRSKVWGDKGDCSRGCGLLAIA